MLRHVFHLVVFGVLYGFSRPCTWIAGPLGTDGRVVGDDPAVRIPIAVGPAGQSWFCSFRGSGR